MTTDAIHERGDPERLVVNVEGTRDIGRPKRRAVPLFDRAMARLIDRRSPTSASLSAVAA